MPYRIHVTSEIARLRSDGNGTHSYRTPGKGGQVVTFSSSPVYCYYVPTETARPPAWEGRLLIREVQEVPEGAPMVDLDPKREAAAKAAAVKAAEEEAAAKAAAEKAAEEEAAAKALRSDPKRAKK